VLHFAKSRPILRTGWENPASVKMDSVTLNVTRQEWYKVRANDEAKQSCAPSSVTTVTSPNSRASKYVMQKWTKLKGEIDNSAVIWRLQFPTFNNELNNYAKDQWGRKT